jgi:maltose-binding protein MalE
MKTMAEMVDYAVFLYEQQVKYLHIRLEAFQSRVQRGTAGLFFCATKRPATINGPWRVEKLLPFPMDP